MSNIFDGAGEIAKREMVLFFLVDQSGSMEGTKMGQVNEAIREAIPMLRDVGGSDAKIKIAALLFSSGCRWMYAEPIPVEDFQWKPVDTFGVTDFGAACQELAKKMSRKAFLKSPSASVAPAIFLMSDGQPTDEYKEGLELLNKNSWFKHAIRVALAIGADADDNVLAEFTGTMEAVTRIYSPEALRKFIHFVTVKTAQIGTQWDSDGDPTKTRQDNMIQKLDDFLKDNPDINQNADDGGW